MSAPVVYIEREPLYTMVLAAIETFRRECFGYIFGYKPTRRSNAFHITNAIAVQLAYKRKNTEIVQSQGGRDRLDKIFKQYGGIYPVLGDFHSHPEWGKHRREADFSENDIKDMKHQGFDIGVVLKIARVNKERILWSPASGGGVRGSLGDYKFHINVCRVVRNSDGEDVSEILHIDATAALKSLNRVLGYDT